MAVTKYQLIVAYSTTDLDKQVNAAIAAGMQPFSDPLFDPNRNVYAQAVTDGVEGGVSPGAAVADATDSTDAPEQLNALLASLRDAGLIAKS